MFEKAEKQNKRRKTHTRIRAKKYDFKWANHALTVAVMLVEEVNFHEIFDPLKTTVLSIHFWQRRRRRRSRLPKLDDWLIIGC